MKATRVSPIVRFSLLLAILALAPDGPAFAGACKPVVGLNRDVGERLFKDPFGRISEGQCADLSHYVWAPERPQASTSTRFHPDAGGTFAGPLNTACGVDNEHGWCMTQWNPKGKGLRLNAALFLNDFYFDSCVCPKPDAPDGCSGIRIAWAITNEGSRWDEPLLVAAAETVWNDPEQLFDWDLVSVERRGECIERTVTQAITVDGPEVQVPRPEVSAGSGAGKVRLDWRAMATWSDPGAPSLVDSWILWVHSDDLPNGRADGLPEGKRFVVGSGRPGTGWMRVAVAPAATSCSGGDCRYARPPVRRRRRRAAGSRFPRSSGAGSPRSVSESRGRGPGGERGGECPSREGSDAGASHPTSIAQRLFLALARGLFGTFARAALDSPREVSGRVEGHPFQAPHRNSQHRFAARLP